MAENKDEIGEILADFKEKKRDRSTVLSNRWLRPLGARIT